MAAFAWACGGSTSTSVVGPDVVRCQTTVTGGPTSMPHSGGQLTVSVSAARDCAWDASTDAAWMQLSATSGQGESTITAAVAANDRGASRTGAVIVNNQRLAVTQEARPCSYDLRATPDQISSAGGRGSIQIQTTSGCGWSASSSESWLRVLTASGDGSGEAVFEAAANSGPPRQASISVAGRPVLVSQAGVGGGPVEPTCAATVGPTTLSAPASGGSLSVTLAIEEPCAWTASSSERWVTLGSESGSGPATLPLSVEPNNGGARSATLTVAGQPVTVNQAAAPACTYTIDADSRTFPADGGEGLVRVNTQGHCAWSASGAPEWISISTSPRTGSGDIGYTVRRNEETRSRTATLMIAGRSHTVTQEAAAAPTCTFRVEPTAASVGADGGTREFTVVTEAGCAWNAASDQGWANVITPSGAGPGPVSYRVDPNGTTAERSARITVNGQTHTVTQAAAAPTCTYRVEPASANFGAGGGNGQFNVITEPGCSWNATSSESWTVVNDASGAGPRQVTYRVDPNSSPTPRSAQISVNGQSHGVTQDGAMPMCSYSVQPGSATFQAAGGNGQFSVVTAEGCAWTASGGESWTVVDNRTGAGPGQVTYRVEPNPATLARSTTIAVNGQPHLISQDAAAPPPPPPEPCTYALDPRRREFEEEGGPGAVRVTTAAHCTWQASTGASWITLLTANGTGPGEVQYTVAPNTSDDEREATIGIADQQHEVEQEEGDDNLDVILTARLPRTSPVGPYCSTCSAQSSFSPR